PAFPAPAVAVGIAVAAAADAVGPAATSPSPRLAGGGGSAPAAPFAAARTRGWCRRMAGTDGRCGVGRARACRAELAAAGAAAMAIEKTAGHRAGPVQQYQRH